MNTLILYESCTGNTALAAELVRRTLEKEGHACTMQRYRHTPPAELAGFDLYCFAAPIQGFAPLAPVYRYLKALPDLPGKPAFILTTGAGWPGQGHRMMARLLHKRGMVVLGARLLPSADNWPLGRMLDRHFYDRVSFPRKGSLRKTRAFVEKMANQAYRYRDGIEVKQASRLLLPTPLLPVGFNSISGWLSRVYGTRSVDVDSCTRCGTCVEGCPVAAVRLDPYPVFSDECIGCWACFNNCPDSAILSSACKTKNYYRGIRNPEKLLKKAGL
jgi:ferredoxin/flavodoxin